MLPDHSLSDPRLHMFFTCRDESEGNLSNDYQVRKLYGLHPYRTDSRCGRQMNSHGTQILDDRELDPAAAMLTPSTVSISLY